MKFLVDQNLSPLVAVALRAAGHDVVHTRDIGMERADDATILERSIDEARTIVSADTDFGTLLASRALTRPSVILLRRTHDRRATAVSALLLANLAAVEESLRQGAIVVLEEDRIRVRRLPLT